MVSGPWTGQVYFKSRKGGSEKQIPVLKAPITLNATVTQEAAPTPATHSNSGIGIPSLFMNLTPIFITFMKTIPFSLRRLSLLHLHSQHISFFDNSTFHEPYTNFQRPSLTPLFLGLDQHNTFAELIELLRVANQTAASQGVNKNSKSLSTFNEFFTILVSNAKKYQPVCKTDWRTFSGIPERDRVAMILEASRGLLDNFSLIHKNLGHFIDSAVNAQMIFEMREVYNNAARALGFAKKIIVDEVAISQLATDYGALVTDTQAILAELLMHVRRYKLRIEANSAPIFKFNLARTSNEIVDALAEWYNSDCDLPSLEASLGKKLPENFKESVPVFAGILGGFLAQAGAEEPDVGVLVVTAAQMLAFIRSYAIDKTPDEHVNELIGVVNEMSQVEYSKQIETWHMM